MTGDNTLLILGVPYKIRSERSQQFTHDHKPRGLGCGLTQIALIQKSTRVNCLELSDHILERTEVEVQYIFTVTVNI